MITKFPKNNKWDLYELLCQYKIKINEIIDVINNGGDISPELLNTINDLKVKTTELISNLNATINNLKETNISVLTNANDIENIKNDIVILKGLIGEGNSNIINDLSQLTLKINTIQSDFENRITTNSNVIITINQSITDIKSLITTINQSLTTITSDISSIKAKNASYDKDIYDLKQNMTLNSQKVDNFISSFDNIELDLTNLTNAINNIDIELNRIDSKATKNSSKIIALENNMNNHESRLSSIEGAGGTGTIQVIDNLESMSADYPLSANQGRVLKGLIDDIQIPPTIEAIKGVNIELNGDITLTDNNNLTSTIKNNYFINAEIVEELSVKKLKLTSSNGVIELVLPQQTETTVDQRCVIGIDANEDGTLSYGHLNGEVTIKDTPYVNNVILSGSQLTFKRNTGDLLITLPTSGGTTAKTVKSIRQDVWNDGLWVDYTDDSWGLVKINELSTITRTIIKVESTDTGKIKSTYHNETITENDTPFFYDINLDIETGMINYSKGNNTIKAIDIKSYIQSLITATVSLSENDFTHYYKIVSDEKIEITKEEYYSIKNDPKYYEMVDGELMEVIPEKTI